MNRYEVKVTVKYTDNVLVDAETREEAEDIAPSLAQPEFDYVSDTEIISEEKINNDI